jgi:hypothetical protein
MSGAPPPKGQRSPRAFAPGVYLRCAACGRMLKIGWATRSIVCSCGARIVPPTIERKPPEG